MKANLLPVLLAARRARDAKEHENAERLYRQVLAADPVNLHAARELGLLLTDVGRYRDAVSVLTPASRRQPGDPELLAVLGRCLWLVGQHNSARAMLEQAVALDPQSASARTWLADCRLADFRADDALTLLAPVLASSPRDARARAVAGRACMASGRFDAGIEHFRAAIAARPDDSLRCDLAWALKRSGRLEESLHEFEAALAVLPSSESLLAGKAEVQESMGDRDAARATVRSAVERGLVGPELAVVNARLSKGKEYRAEAVALVERALSGMSPGSPLRAPLLLALGSLRDAGGDYDAAFAAFREANDLYPRVFDGAAHERAMQGLLDVFSPANLARMPRAQGSDPLPVFIVGMPRSGTSLVEQVLASHPLVHGAGELDDLPRLAGEIPRILGLPGPAAFPACVPDLSASQLGTLASRHLDRLRALGPRADRVTDKLPHNFTLLGLVEVLFPGARVVHCVRNPLDTCLSCYMTDLSNQHAYKRHLADLAVAYRVYRKMMEHWRGVLRTPILDVRYEDLIADTEANVRRLLEFAGLPWDERCLRPHENKRVVHTASIDQVRRPIYDSSVNRWRHYERHIGELIEGLRDVM